MNEKNGTGRRKFLAGMVKPSKCVGTMTFREGSHGEKVSLLGYGGMRMPTLPGAPDKFDMKAIEGHVDALYKGGVNYFDAAPVYCQGQCEKILGQILRKYPRESYYVVSKLSNFAKNTWSHEASVKIYEQSQKDFNLGHIDFYFLHAVGAGGDDPFRQRCLDNGMLEFCMKERDAGRIKNLGFSFHGPVKFFDQAIAMHDKVHWDMVQIQLNYLDWDHSAEVNPRNPNASYMYAECAKRGIPVTVMEPLLGGRLAKFNYTAATCLVPFDPEETMAGWAFRFAGTHPKVLTVLSGMNRIDHIEENIRTFSPLKPLNAEQMKAMDEVALAVLADKTVPCNYCNYCMPCPYGLDIPAILSTWNAALVEKRVPDDPSATDYEKNRHTFLAEYEAAIPDRLRRADHCTGCGRCAPHCPQQIDVPREISRIAARVAALRARKGFAQ